MMASMQLMYDAIIRKNYPSLPEQLKLHQVKVVQHLLNKKNVFCNFPTGFGKSLCFGLLPLVLDELIPESQPHVAIIISPLRSLMINQCSEWNNKGIKAAAILRGDEMEDAVKKDILNGKYSLVFSSPEAIMSKPWKDMLRSEPFKKRLCLFAIDEAHCIIEWGAYFRPIYKKVGHLRSILDDKTTPLLFLTATVTDKMKEDILQTFFFADDDVTTVAVLPDRPNIYLQFVSHSNMNFEEDLKWYIEELQVNNVKADKAIIYCRSINVAADIWHYIMDTLRDDAFASQERKPETRLVDMYHAVICPRTEKRILESFTDSNSNLRCVVATVAFGMGIQINDVRYVIHWGASKSILGYWQEVGRCSRDGKRGKAYLYATLPSLSKIMTDKSMIDMCVKMKNASIEDVCLRSEVISSLSVSGFEGSAIAEMNIKSKCDGKCLNGCVCDLCMCCSFCKRRCTCKSAASEI